MLPGVRTPVEIGRLAPRVIVAHRLLEPGAPAGHAVGRAVADYAFHLAGGEVVTARADAGRMSIELTEGGRTTPWASVTVRQAPEHPSTRAYKHSAYGARLLSQDTGSDPDPLQRDGARQALPLTRRAAWVNGQFADEVVLGMLASDWASAGKPAGR